MTLLQFLETGCLLGGVYALLSVGLALLAGMMKGVHVAQGDVMLLGLYLTYVLSISYGVPPVLSALLTIPPLYGLGVVGSRLWPRHGAEQTQAMETQLMLTLGLALLISGSVTMFLSPIWPTLLASLALLHSHGPWPHQARIYACGAALLIVCGVALFLHYTDIGKALRAATDDPEAAMYMGINVRRMHTLSLALGLALAAVAAGLLATLWPMPPHVPGHCMVLILLGVIVGGLGSMVGAFVGGLLLGIVQTLSLLVLPFQLQHVGMFVALLLLLCLRPRGLFERRRAV